MLVKLKGTYKFDASAAASYVLQLSAKTAIMDKYFWDTMATYYKHFWPDNTVTIAAADMLPTPVARISGPEFISAACEGETAVLDASWNLYSSETNGFELKAITWISADTELATFVTAHNALDTAA